MRITRLSNLILQPKQEMRFTVGKASLSRTTFAPDGSWDKTTRRISVNARLLDNFDAAIAPVVVIDGKNLW